MKKVVIFLFALFSLSSMAWAQEGEEVSAQTTEDSEDSSEQTKEGFKSNWFVGVGEGAVVNKFKDNWFLGVGPAVQFFTGAPADGSMFDHTNVGFNLFGGKWFTPDFGFDAGVRGVTFKDAMDDPQSYLNINLNLMVNVHNLFLGYSESRRWEISPYIGPALAMSNFRHNAHFGYALSAGLHNTFNMNEIIPYVGDKVFLFFDVNAFWNDKEFDHMEPESDGYAVDAIYSLSIGAVYRFPKRGWTTSFIMY